MPVTGSFSYACTGQPFRHAGSTQWWHAVVTVCWAGACGVPPWSRPTRRQVSLVVEAVQAVARGTHALQPVQVSRSTSNAYCCPGPGGSAGISSR